MKPNSYGSPPEGHSCRATKRKHSVVVEEFDQHNHSKKRRTTVSRAVNLSRKPDPSCSLSHSNRFEVIHSTKKRKGRRKRKTSSAEDGHRQWVFSSRDFSNFKHKFVVVSYNILGVENAMKHPELYTNVPPECLEWDWRKKRIREEVNRYNAGIICFQEVDRFNDLDVTLQKDGFRGVYKARTGDVYDGCAIFWRDQLFTLLHQEYIEFQKFGLRNNVAQLCILKMEQDVPESETHEQLSMTSKTVLVGNIHVLFNPNRGDIKLGQVRLFIEKAYKLSQDWGGIPVLLAGDLNSTPQSAIYQFLASSELDLRQHDRRNISGQVEFPLNCRYHKFDNRSGTSFSRWSNEELRLATGNDRIIQLRHQLQLFSAYFGIPGSSRTRDRYGEPFATSHHAKFMGTVDYIWHTKELLPVKLLETVPVDLLRRSVGLPSERWGSDHFALVCELAFADKDPNKT